MFYLVKGKHWTMLQTSHCTISIEPFSQVTKTVVPIPKDITDQKITRCDKNWQLFFHSIQNSKGVCTLRGFVCLMTMPWKCIYCILYLWLDSMIQEKNKREAQDLNMNFGFLLIVFVQHQLTDFLLIVIPPVYIVLCSWVCPPIFHVNLLAILWGTKDKFIICVLYKENEVHEMMCFF